MYMLYFQEMHHLQIHQVSSYDFFPYLLHAAYEEDFVHMFEVLTVCALLKSYNSFNDVCSNFIFHYKV